MSLKDKLRGLRSQADARERSWQSEQAASRQRSKDSERRQAEQARQREAEIKDIGRRELVPLLQEIRREFARGSSRIEDNLDEHGGRYWTLRWGEWKKDVYSSGYKLRLTVTANKDIYIQTHYDRRVAWGAPGWREAVEAQVLAALESGECAWSSPTPLGPIVY